MKKINTCVSKQPYLWRLRHTKTLGVEECRRACSTRRGCHFLLNLIWINLEIEFELFWDMYGSQLSQIFTDLLKSWSVWIDFIIRWNLSMRTIVDQINYLLRGVVRRSASRKSNKLEQMFQKSFRGKFQEIF